MPYSKNPSAFEIFFLVVFALAMCAIVTGCATLTTTVSTICDNREIVRDQAERQIEAASNIEDPTKRAAVLAIATFTLAALEKCNKLP